MSIFLLKDMDKVHQTSFRKAARAAGFTCWIVAGSMPQLQCPKVTRSRLNKHVWYAQNHQPIPNRIPSEASPSGFSCCKDIHCRGSPVHVKQFHKHSRDHGKRKTLPRFKSQASRCFALGMAHGFSLWCKAPAPYRQIWSAFVGSLKIVSNKDGDVGSSWCINV